MYSNNEKREKRQKRQKNYFAPKQSRPGLFLRGVADSNIAVTPLSLISISID